MGGVSQQKERLQGSADLVSANQLNIIILKRCGTPLPWRNKWIKLIRRFLIYKERTLIQYLLPDTLKSYHPQSMSILNAQKYVD
jgi:hypothetical protein